MTNLKNWLFLTEHFMTVCEKMIGKTDEIKLRIFSTKSKYGHKIVLICVRIYFAKKKKKMYPLLPILGRNFCRKIKIALACSRFFI